MSSHFLEASPAKFQGVGSFEHVELQGPTIPKPQHEAGVQLEGSLERPVMILRVISGSLSRGHRSCFMKQVVEQKWP